MGKSKNHDWSILNPKAQTWSQTSVVRLTGIHILVHDQSDIILPQHQSLISCFVGTYPQKKIPLPRFFPPIHLQTGCKMKAVSKFATNNIFAADPAKHLQALHVNSVTAGFLTFYNSGEVQLSFKPPPLLMFCYFFLAFLWFWMFNQDIKHVFIPSF